MARYSNPITVKNRIAEFRVARGLSQVALGRLMGMKNPKIVAQYETGTHQTGMNVATAFSFARALGVSVDELFIVEVRDVS